MKEDAKLSVQFWGVRGSCPTPGAQNADVGGNTPCLKIGVPRGDIIIFDCGTGARALGEELSREATGALKLNIFLTHFHCDPILDDSDIPQG